jgi:hypothetical protein
MDVEDDRHWAEWYRLGASAARQRAKSVTSEITRQVLLKLADDYDELAAEHEKWIALKSPKSD